MKITVVIIVLLLALGGATWWIMSHHAPNNLPIVRVQRPTTSSTSTPETPTSPSIVSAAGSSDGWIMKKMSEIDMQINGFTSDNGQIDQSLNDQPVTQGQ